MSIEFSKRLTSCTWPWDQIFWEGSLAKTYLQWELEIHSHLFWADALRRAHTKEAVKHSKVFGRVGIAHSFLQNSNAGR